MMRQFVAMDVPVLWHFPISHFNEKVRWALDYKGIPHVRRVLGPSYLPRALWATGRPTLPILFLDGRAIGDSTDIIAALERHRPDPPLYPTNEAERRRALELEDYFDEELGHAIRTAIVGPMFEAEPDAALALLTTGMPKRARSVVRPVFPLFAWFYKRRHRIDDRTVKLGRAKVRAAIDRLESGIGSSGYLVGDRFTVADLTAASLFSPVVLPPEFPYRPEPGSQTFERYRDELGDRRGLRWVADLYRRHRGRSCEVRA